MNNNDFIFTGAVDIGSVYQTISWVLNRMKDPTDPLKKLNLYISSTGGDIDSAIRLHDFLKSIPVEVTTISFGQIDSAANLIYLAGTNRLSTTNCRFFLHEGTYTVGNPSSALHIHDESIRLFKVILDSMSNIISSELKKEKTEVESYLREGKILTAKEAEKMGIVTELVEKIYPISV